MSTARHAREITLADKLETLARLVAIVKGESAYDRDFVFEALTSVHIRDGLLYIVSDDDYVFDGVCNYINCDENYNHEISKYFAVACAIAPDFDNESSDTPAHILGLLAGLALLDEELELAVSFALDGQQDNSLCRLIVQASKIFAGNDDKMISVWAGSIRAHESLEAVLVPA